MSIQQPASSLFSSQVDLNAYFRRIGYEGCQAPTLETLRSLHHLHPQAIPFENLSPFTGQPVLLDAEALSQKLIEDRRGGYCFEQNLLFGQVLHALGFQVQGLVARVRWNAPPHVVTPRTHMVLLIALEGSRYIADVGFGGPTLTAPLRLEPNREQETPHESFRLTELSLLAGQRGSYQLEVQLQGEWKPIYAFNLEPQYIQDYNVMSWYTSTYPTSLFVTTLVAARPAPGRRYALRNNQLSIRFLSGETERHTLATLSDLRSTLSQRFRLNLAKIPELDQRLEALLANHLAI